MMMDNQEDYSTREYKTCCWQYFMQLGKEIPIQEQAMVTPPFLILE